MRWNDFGLQEYDPFLGIRRLRQEMNKLFDGYGTEREAEAFPAVNLWSNADEVVVTAEVPGVESKDMDVRVEGDQLILKGDRKAEAPEADAVLHRTERGFGQFVRTFRLPYAVDADKVTASYARGVLTVKLPRTEGSKPKKIAIAGA